MNKSWKIPSHTALIVPDGRTRVYDKYRPAETGKKSRIEHLPLPAKDVFIGKMSSLCRRYAEKYYNGHWFILTTNNRKGQDYLVSPDEEIEGWYDNPPYPIPGVLDTETGRPRYWQPFSGGSIGKIRKKAEDLGIFENYSRIIFLGNAKETDNFWWQQKSWDGFIRKNWSSLSEEMRNDKDLEIYIPARREFEYSLYTDVLRNVFVNDEPWLEFPLVRAPTTPRMMSRISDAIFRDFPLRRSPVSLVQGTVHDLFRMGNPYFTYRNVPLGNRKNVQIITAPNGFGKSTLFRLFRAVFAGNLREIASVPFKKLELSLDCGDGGKRVLVITRPETRTKNEPAMTFSLSGSRQEKAEEFTVEDLEKSSADADWEKYKKDMGLRLGKIIPPLSLRYIPAERLRYDTSESVRKYDLLADPDYLAASVVNPDDPDTIYYTGERKTTDVSRIAVYAKSLEKRIDGILTDFATISHEIDTKFPLIFLRELSRTKRKKFSDLKSNFSDLDELRESLEKTDLLPFRRWYRKKSGDGNEEVDPFASSDGKSLPSDFRKFIDIYSVKQKEKYEVFDWMRNRCSYFERTVNDLLVFTRVRIQKDGGLAFYNYYQDKDESSVSRYHNLSAGQISSGEMHQIVVLYDSLFNCDPETCILIDEPEISMHIAWQEKFIDTVLKIAEINHIRFLVATHSTDIINQNWDITHDLLGGAYS